MFTKKFWVDAAERVLSSTAQAALGAIAAATTFGWAFDGRSWATVGVVSAGAAITSMLKCLIMGRSDGSDGERYLDEDGDGVADTF